MTTPALRVAYFGSPAFAVPTLERLVASRHQVVCVVTQPDRPRGRGQRVTEGPVKTIAAAHGIPTLQPATIAREPFEREFGVWQADIGVVAAYGKILPEWLLRMPRLGMINVHASLLPRWRGAAPIHRAVMAGDQETGVTIMRVVKALDAGGMFAKVYRAIGPDDTSEEIEHALAAAGADLLLDVVEDLAAGIATETPQDEHLVTYAHRLTKEEALLDWTLPAVVLHNRIRGLRPWPGTHTVLDRARIIVHRSRVVPDESVDGLPGTILGLHGEGLRVVAGDGCVIELLRLQAEGKRALPAAEFAAARELTGLRFS